MEGLIIYNSMQHLPPKVEGAEHMSRLVLVDHLGKWNEARYYFLTGQWCIFFEGGHALTRNAHHAWTWKPDDLQKRLEFVMGVSDFGNLTGKETLALITEALKP